MGNNIPLSSQSNSSGGGGAAFQDWYFEVTEIRRVYSVSANQLPGDADINGTIKDFAASTWTDTHEDFVLRVRVEQDPDSPSLIDPTFGFGATGADRDLSIGGSGIQEVFEYAFARILPPGTYTSFYHFEVFATNKITVEQEFIESRSVTIIFERVGEEFSVLDPRNFDLVYLKGTGALNSQDVQVIPSTREDSNPRWFTIIWPLFDVVITNANNDGQTILAHGDQVMTVTPNGQWEFEPAGFKQEIIELIFQDSDERLGVGVGVQVFDAPGIDTDKDLIVFLSLVPSTAARQELRITATGQFTITAPAWLQLTASQGEFVLDLGVEPISVDNFTAGEYRGDIVITMGAITHTVQVVHTVQDQLGGTLKREGINFTLDGGDLVMSGYGSNHYMQVQFLGLTYDQDGSARQIVHRSIVPFVNDRAVYVPGLVVDQFMGKLDELPSDLELITSSTVYYPKITKLDLVVKVINRLSRSTVVERLLSGTKWVCGNSPKLGYEFKRGFLEYDAGVARITPKGFFIANMFNESAGTVQVRLNGTEERSIALAGGDSPAARAVINGADYLPGDRIELRVDTSSASVQRHVSQHVIIMPEQRRSCHIIYVTDYNTVESMQLTGAVRASIGYDRRTNILLRNNVEIAHHVDVLGTHKLLINTGYIPQKQVAMVHRLNRAKRKWLLFDGLGPIELSNSTQEMVSYDSEEFLYDYEIECRINHKNNAQVYSF